MAFGSTDMGKRKAEDDLEAEIAEEELLTPEVVQRAADTTPAWHNKEKVLLLSSRGITHRYIQRVPLSMLMILLTCKSCIRPDRLPTPLRCRHRHLMLDLMQLLPHCKKDAKLDTKTDKGVISEVADMKVCKPAASCDLAVTPDGPALSRHVPLDDIICFHQFPY